LRFFSSFITKTLYRKKRKIERYGYNEPRRPEVGFLGEPRLQYRRRRFYGIKSIWSREFKEQLCVVGAAVVFALGILLFASSRCVVMVDGAPVGTVAKRGIAEEVVRIIQREQEDALGQAVTLRGNVTYRSVRGARDGLLTAEELKRRLISALHLYTPAAVVRVDGKERFYFRNKKTARAFLDSVRRMYTVKPDESVSFDGKVDVVVKSIPVDRITGTEEALSAVRTGIEENWRYTVKDGDTLWDIAAAEKVTLEDIIAANPSLNPDRLTIGQVIALRREKPVLTVVQVFETVKEEPIPFPREVQYDRSLHRGQVKVVKAGKPGTKEITYRVTVHNGVEVSRELLRTRQVKAPEKQIERRGSLYLLASRGEGRASLGWPLSGPILSGYGMRWGRMHTGLDIGAGYGTSVGAAGSGTVVRAGWNGGYGRTVEVDHGDGVVTRYAHLSSVNVGTGEVVGRGQNVGRVGSTGHSTGPHLHFEVLVNDAPRNPLNYL
jgi:murein DD-endopeptidase MepM/ murein hydrolase activator NlpD